MTEKSSFIHLRVHSEYSLLEGAVKIKSLPTLCAKMDMPAVAVTDTNNLFAALEFSVGASDAGVQPIIGCQIDLQYKEPDQSGKTSPASPLVLLAQSERGYANLMKLNSCLYIDASGQLPQITLNDLRTYSADLICLSGGASGPVGKLLQTSQIPAAKAFMTQLSEIFPNRLYVEIQRHPTENGLPDAEQQTEAGFVEMAFKMDLPLVATNDVYFKDSSMYEAHDALICIAEGAYVDQQEPRRRLTAQHYFKTQQEMITLFADLPEAIENTIEIAQRCAFKAHLRDPILPKFADNEIEELRRQSRQGLKDRLAVIPLSAEVDEYEKRLEFELGIIEGMGFPGYFLIVADFRKWS